MLKKKSKKKLPERNIGLCPFNGRQASWCRGLCTPYKGKGPCGRPAPHIMQSRIQRAIASYERKKS
jgi:hypothetical protein